MPNGVHWFFVARAGGNIGHECRPFLLGIQITLCELQFSAYLKVPGRSFDARKIWSLQCRITQRLFCRSYGELQTSWREKCWSLHRKLFLLWNHKRRWWRRRRGDREEAGDDPIANFIVLLALTATSPPNTDGYLEAGRLFGSIWKSSSIFFRGKNKIPGKIAIFGHFQGFWAPGGVPIAPEAHFHQLCTTECLKTFFQYPF